MRRRQAKKRSIETDPCFNNEIVARFINSLMWEGKKTVAQRILYSALSRVEAVEKRSGLEVFLEALGNVKPTLEVRSRRVGGATYPIPVPVRPERAQALSIRWMIRAARDRSERSMENRLAAEIRDAAAQKGGSFKKRSDIEKMADANRAFSHYRF